LNWEETHSRFVYFEIRKHRLQRDGGSNTSVLMRFESSGTNSGCGPRASANFVVRGYSKKLDKCMKGSIAGRAARYPWKIQFSFALRAIAMPMRIGIHDGQNTKKSLDNCIEVWQDRDRL